MTNKNIHNPTTDDRFDINDLVQKAKKKGSLDSEEIIEAIEACGLSDEDAEKVYQKLMELGPNYRDTVTTAEAVQISTEGVDQLEIYFGKYVPQFF